MTIRRAFRVVAAVALTLLLHAPGFAADEVPEGPAAALARAEALIVAGEPAEALDLLRPLAESDPDNTAAWFFRGMAASHAARLPEGQPGATGVATDEARRALRDEAVASYRHILQRRPALGGARLELARALFERGRCLAPPEDLLEHLLGDDCDAAAHHFRRALAGDLPETVAGAVSRFLAAVQARRRVSGQFRMALAPDSNVNAGTEARTFRLRFLPLEFEIDERTRATSGVGVVVSASGEYRHPLAFQPFEETATRLRVGAGVWRREHGGSRFDDMTLSLHAGPEVLFRRARASLLARADRRWSAGDPVSDGLGLRLGERLWLGAGGERMERRHRDAPANDGPRLDLDLDLAYAVTPAITFGVRGGWQRTRAEGPPCAAAPAGSARSPAPTCRRCSAPRGSASNSPMTFCSPTTTSRAIR